MASKRKKPSSSTVELSALSQTSRIWQRRRCDEINRLLTAASTDDSRWSDADRFSRWTDADRLLADVGNQIPDCLLPSELINRIVGLNLEPLPPDLWRIVAGYMPAGPTTIPAGSVASVAYARAVCLAAMNRPNDAAVLVERLPAETTGRFGYRYEFAQILFLVNQHYEMAAEFFDQLIAIDPELNDDCHIFRSLSRIFAGKADSSDMKPYTMSYFDSDLVNWTDFGSNLLAMPFVRQSFVELRLSINAYQNGHTRFIRYLLDSMLADESTWPATFDATWLRMHHRAVIGMTDFDWRTELYLRCPSVSNLSFYSDL